MGVFAQYFARPRGPLGWLAGEIMAIENKQRNAFALSILNPNSGDRVLEIGFGPGVNITPLAERIGDGRVVGIDNSPVLVGQARRRNAATIASGRAALLLGSADQLPFPDYSFDRALAVNSFHHWQGAGAGLAEVRRVLVPGGVLVIAEQPVWADRNADDIAIARQLATDVTAAGFERVEIVSRRMRSAPTICVRATAPAGAAG